MARLVAAGGLAAAAILLGAAAVSLPSILKVALVALGAVGFTAWGTWRLLSPTLASGRVWGWASTGGWLVSLALGWAFVEASWTGLWRGPGGLRIADLLLMGLGVYGLVGLRTAPPGVRRLLVLLGGAVGLIVAGALLAALAHGAGAPDVEALARAAFAVLLIPAVVVRFVRSERRLETVVLATVISVAVASAAATGTQLTGAWILPFDDDFGGQRSYGLSNHPALFGIAAAASLPLAVGLTVAGRGAVRVSAAICIPLLLLGLVLSASRAPLAAGALAVVLVLFALRTGGRRGRVVLVLALVTAVGAAGLVLPERVDRLSDANAQRSALARVELITTATSGIVTSPLVGEGASAIKGARNLEPSDAFIAGSTAELRVGGGVGASDIGAHNLVLQTWRALGLLGLVGLLLALSTGVVAGVHAMRFAPSARMRSLAVAVLASFGVIVACLMVFDAVFERQLWLTLGLLCTLGLAAHGAQARQAQPRAATSDVEPLGTRGGTA